MSYQAQAFMHNVKKYGLSHESEGLVVTADPEVIKQIMMNKQHSDLRSFFYKVSTYIGRRLEKPDPYFFWAGVWMGIVW